MNIGVNYRSVVAGVGWIVSGSAVLLGYAFLVARPLGPSGYNGNQILLMFFSPVVLGGWAYFAGRGMMRIWSGLTRYTLDNLELIVRTPLWSRVVRWNSVASFVLPPATFPRAPEKLLLLAGDGRKLTLPLPRIRSAGAEPLLLSSVPGLSAHGIDSARDPEPRSCSILRTRWRLYGSELPGLYAVLILFLLFTLGGLAFSWDFINFLRISRRHFTATARITEITRDDSGRDERVWTRVQYVASNGQTVRLHRKVLVSFADNFKTGDDVQVDYLPGNPRVGRIPGWDADGRMWVLLLLTSPVVFVMYRATRLSLSKWLRPLRERLAWVAKGQTGRFGFSGANLAELYALLPDRHRGTFILKPPSGSQKKPGLWAWSRWFRRAGIEGRAAEGKFLILNPDQSRRMLSRVGGGNPFPGDYMVLDTASAEDAEKILHERLANPNTPANEPATDHIVLSCIDSVVGPVTEQEMISVFQAWIAHRLRRLYGGMTPPEIPEVDFVQLLAIDPTDGAYDMLIERRNSGPRIWLRNLDEPRASLAECPHGRWILTANLKIPATLNARRLSRLLKRRKAAEAPAAGSISSSPVQARQATHRPT